MESLENWSITADDLAGTFHDGRDTLERYRMVSEADSNSSLREIASIISRRFGLDFSFNNVRSWRRLVHEPRVVASINHLIRLGVFGVMESSGSESYLRKVKAFDAKNPLFEAINLIASMAYWCGSCSNSNNCRSETWDIRINNKDLPSEETTDLIKKLGFGDKKEKYLTLNSDIARIIALMGIPTGNKAESEIFFPMHIARALNSIDEGSEFREIALRVIHDFVMTFIVSKGGVDEKNGRYQASLIRHRDPSALIEARNRLNELLSHSGIKNIREHSVQEHANRSAQLRIVSGSINESTRERLRSDLCARIKLLTKI